MSPRARRATLALLLAAAASLAALPARAQVFKDAALDALYRADRVADLERVSGERASAHPDDAQAVLGLAITALVGNDGAKREAAIQRAEACLRQAPQAAPCHYALGSVLGVHAMSQGMIKMIGSVGRIKGALSQAMSLEPGWYTARSAMVEFFLQAPSIAGGGTRKAEDVARAAPQPAQALALRARVAVKEEQYDTAVALLGEIRSTHDTAVAEDMQQLWITAGVGLLGKGRRDEARQVFERLTREQPESAAGPYGMARVMIEAGAYADAAALLERSAQLKGADRLPVDYRLGIARQGLGQRDAAKAAFNRFVASGRGSRGALDDARKRLTELGA